MIPVFTELTTFFCVLYAGILFAATAESLGLPPGRLLPHSFRSGAIAQLVAARVPVNLLLDQGDWHSLQGMFARKLVRFMMYPWSLWPSRSISILTTASSYLVYSVRAE